MTPKHPVPFSWSAFLLAPLVIPVPAGVLFAGESEHPVVAFGLGAVIGYVFALATMGCLLLPALWLVSWAAKVRTWLAAVIGGLLATLIVVAWDYTSWCSSGVDSGPPAETYPQWIAKSWVTPEALVVISLGVVTAAAYHFLATRKPKQPPPAIPHGREA